MKRIVVLLFCISTCITALSSNPFRRQVKDTQIEIHFYSPQIVRVIKYPAGADFRKETLSVIRQPEITPVEQVQESTIVQLKSAALCVTLNTLTGDIAFTGLDTRPLLAEKPYSSVLANGKRLSQTFLMDKQEPIYGLGQQQEGVMNHRGKSVQLIQENMKIAIPFFQSVKGYGLFWDNYSATQFSDKPDGATFSSEMGDGIDYYFLYGGSMDGVIACMRDLTGQVPLFPLWSWGYWQSRERYVSQKELVETVQRYRDLQVPLDGIVQDWQYWSTDNAYWNGMEFKNPEFPRPEQMVQDIHRLNAHVLISVWPSFGTKTEPYAVLKGKGLLLDFESFPQADSVRVYDAFNPQARTIYWDFLNKFLFSIGIDGWWLDATEPEHSGKPSNHLNYNKLRNAFPLLTVGGVYEHQRNVSDSKRVYILTRSAFAGQQRYATSVWSGDVDGNWETLRKQIPAGLNFSLCALPYWNTDIGGFWVRDGSSQYADYRELYVRWLQFGAFLPMMRSHGTSTPREIWQFGQKGDWAYDAIEKYIRLRYKLLPYNYSLSWEVTSKAGSILRPLVMDFPNDPKVWDMGTEYLYGHSLLVAPVTQPFYAKGAKAQSTVDFSQTQTTPVYLPQGADWYDFWTGEKQSGGIELQRETPIDLLPLYVKAGSILPFGPDIQYAGEKSGYDLELRIYPGADAEFTLYEDENDQYNYEQGNYSTIRMLWNDANRRLTIEDRRGAFSGMLEERIFTVKIIGSQEIKKILYKGKRVHFIL